MIRSSMMIIMRLGSRARPADSDDCGRMARLADSESEPGRYDSTTGLIRVCDWPGPGTVMVTGTGKAPRLRAEAHRALPTGPGSGDGYFAFSRKSTKIPTDPHIFLLLLTRWRATRPGDMMDRRLRTMQTTNRQKLSTIHIVAPFQSLILHPFILIFFTIFGIISIFFEMENLCRSHDNGVSRSKFYQ
jgi:hypothetical protein